ncbi:MAG: malto-oligosyltrehalose trehalohydrolase [Polycyclovorans sp.]|jgi:maltooligosyltrehalose trehalohydrolase|nr:malto-oligosyltrehalose trehalohydrolase [Polycyclovorans sp.]
MDDGCPAVARPSARFEHCLPFGAHHLGDGLTRFRFWAPAQAQILLEVEGFRPCLMRKGSDGIHEVEVPCTPGAHYRYRLDNSLGVPDPCSRAQTGGVHGSSVVVDPLAYEWRHPDWRGRPWHETVIYELHAGVCGGYAQVMKQLPELVELGVTAIELMPIAQFPGQRNWGYDGALPFAPQSSYGTPEQLKCLVDTAHGLGLQMFLDVVYNHFGPEGCYLHHYAPQFFRADRVTPWGPAIDFRQVHVRDFFTHNVLYWLEEYRFDGLRFDAVHQMEDCGWLREIAESVRLRFSGQRHVHLMLENEAYDMPLLRRSAASGYDAQWNDDFHNAVHVLLTHEDEGYYRNFSEAPAHRLAQCLAEKPAFPRGGPVAGDGVEERPAPGVPPQAFVSFLQNHDQVGNRAFGERLIMLAEPEALHAALALLLLSPQIPLIFMGEEWGSRDPFLFFTDHPPALARAVREGRRNEFRQFSSFLAHDLDVPDPNDPASFIASVPTPSHVEDIVSRQWRERYRTLLALRHRHIIPRLQDPRTQQGARTAVLGVEVIGSAAVRARWRLGDARELCITVNLADEAVPCARPPGVVLYDSSAGRTQQASQVMPPLCCRATLN